MNTYETINDVLVHLFNEIWELEEKAIITEEYKDITNNDMHIIEAIGLGEGKTMSAIAKKMNETAGTLTTSMNSLERPSCRLHQPDRKRRTGISSSCGFSYPDDRCGDPESGER